MIQKTVGFKASDGTVHETIEGAQKAELLELLRGTELGVASETVTEAILDNRDSIIDILTTTAKSRPKARAANGGKKTRTAKLKTVAPEPGMSNPVTA